MGILITALGLSVGSFLNVCICRIPRRQSVITGRSRCPDCTGTLSWWHNIPIVSYIFLRGRCAFCGGRICRQYPLVEALAAVACILLYRKYGLSEEFGIYLFLTSLLIIIAAIDATVLRIPNSLVLMVSILGVLRIMAASVLLRNALLGAAAAAVSLLLLSAFGRLLSKGESVGMGDVKLATAMGFVLGPQKVLAAIGLAILLGGGIGAIGLISGRLSRDSRLPFGTFLSLTAFITLLEGAPLQSALTTFFWVPWM